jgi:hypothetical protein
MSVAAESPNSVCIPYHFEIVLHLRCATGCYYLAPQQQQQYIYIYIYKIPLCHKQGVEFFIF